MAIAKPNTPEEISRAFIGCARDFFQKESLRKIEGCLQRLTDEQIWWRANEESNSIGNLLLHLSGNARQWIASGLGGKSNDRDRDWEFSQRDGITGVELLNRLRDTLSEVDRILAELDSSQMLESREIQGTQVTVLEAIFHVTEHFSMHTGQIIYITKLLSEKDLHFV